ncbi:adenylosuccinate synthase [symbiont of Argiope bruennichi]|uniref:adenylosuccinate synthase n=1 Tax=symbiont of Argiope bruennichi TaxID=2810479 RepID=UPI003DA5ACB3
MEKKNFDCVIGCFWGDEGKGKVIDLISKDYQYVVRSQGGDNAGHTIKIKDKTFKLSILPSGALRNKICLITSGCVINLEKLLNEVLEIEQKSKKKVKVFVSLNTHIILPYHKILDEINEKVSGKNKIGTTLRGIGPSYIDKFGRIGIRIVDLFNDEKILKEKIKNSLILKNIIFKHFNYQEFKVNDIFNYLMGFKDFLLNKTFNNKEMFESILKSNKKCLFEGAQGTMLCIENGTYPYVTSSSPTSLSIPLNSTISHKNIGKIIGITKIYCSRVGNGFMPTIIKPEKIDLKKIKLLGNEFGTVTGREREIGWLDLVILKYSVELNQINMLSLMHLDVFSHLNIIKLCVGYHCNGKILKKYPQNYEDFLKCVPIYKTFKGWNLDISNIKKYQDLPKNCQKIIEYIEKYVNCKIKILSVGAARKKTIYKD